MGEKIIDLDYSTYANLVKIMQNGQENIYFRYDNDMVSIPNKIKNKSNSSSEQNIVQKWMNDITKIAEQGHQVTTVKDTEDYFNNIKSYCRAVIISVTS